MQGEVQNGQSRQVPHGRPVQPQKRVSNASIFAGCAVFVTCMVGAAYAAVPLYQLFCQVTGYGGTTKRVEQYSAKVLDRTMNVTFDANISSGLNWEFKAARPVTPKIGETVQVEFTAKNLSSVATTGTAAFNVTPMDAGAYFNKVQCFCFTEQTLQPGESITMPVVFYVDPEIVNSEETKNLRTLTLSYSFYPSTPSKPVAAVSRQGEGAASKL